MKQHTGHSEKSIVRKVAISVAILVGTALTLSIRRGRVGVYAFAPIPRVLRTHGSTATERGIPPIMSTVTNRTQILPGTGSVEAVSTVHSATLLQKRLFENYGIPITDTILVQDDEEVCGVETRNSEEKKDDHEPTSTSAERSAFDYGAQTVVEIKTLVWELVVVGTGSTRRSKITQRFHVVAALQMKDKVNMPRLKALVLNRQHERSEGVSVIWSIQSMQLAPLKVAESLTGYESGCMPPICHSSNLELYVDRSIVDIYQQSQDDPTAAVASIGSGILGKSSILDLGQFLRVAGAHSNAEDCGGDTNGTACTVGSFVASGSLSTGMNSASVETTARYADENESATPNEDTDIDAVFTVNERKMMSGSEIRKLKQEERKQQRETKKDRLKEYRSFGKDDIINKAKLLRTTARKKGRTEEMEILLEEALACGEFCKLMEIPDEQTPRTNIDKNALHICAWRGDYETVVRLVNIANEHCPELDVVNLISKGPGNYGKTPIFYALTQCRDDVVRYLVLEAGADLLIVNNKGQTPCSIARSHLNEETCQLLYKIEAEQIAARSTTHDDDELFVNYRTSVHSDGKLYGDLDPRFPIDEGNRYFHDGKLTENTADTGDKEEGEKGRWADLNGYDPKIFIGKDYMDRNDDLTDQIKEYENSVRSAPENTVILGIPTVFSPRSLRPTVRWWNREDRSLAAANNDNSNANGQVTFTQSRPRRCKKSDQIRETEEMPHAKGQPSTNRNKVSRFGEADIDIESLELITIQDCIGSDASTDDNGTVVDNNTFLVDNPESLSRFEAEVDKCLAKLRRDLESIIATEDDGFSFGHDETILLKYAWGLDCEWKPGPECGLDSPVSTLQLATSKTVFLIDLQTICRTQESRNHDSSMEIDLDRTLLKLFRNPNMPLVGFGVVQDLGKLAASFPNLTCFSKFDSVMDLQSVSSVVYSNKRDRRTMSSLQKMTAALLNKQLDKAQQISNWSHRPLSDEQTCYAMLDAAIIPLLLNTIVEDSEVVTRYNGQFFNTHKNLLSTIRFTPVEPCEEGFAYEVSFGSIKSVLGKAFARQSWPTKMKLDDPEPPKLVPCQGIANNASSTPTLSKKERAHLRKIGGTSRTRPKPIPLKSLAGNLQNLPIPGIFLGYTKESCAFRVVGHELFKSIPEGTYIGFNRRAGVVETSNAWILFCNFGGEKAFSEFSDNGRKLSFRVSSTAQSGRSSESSLYRKMTRKRAEEGKKIILFARESTRTKYMYCGFCSCAEVIPLDSQTASLVLKLEDYEELMNPDIRIASDFEHLVGGSTSDAS